MNLAGIFVYWNRKASASARAAGARRPAVARARVRVGDHERQWAR